MKKNVSPGVVVLIIAIVVIIVGLFVYRGTKAARHDEIRPTQELSDALKAGKAPIPGLPQQPQGQ